MAYIARNKNNTVCAFEENSSQYYTIDYYCEPDYGIALPNDADIKLIGRHIEYSDWPVEAK